ncbi:MAG: hypothetical protein IJI66_02895 [Erysipelotrichaceae bacterium]|nr:hypothetical protein [Erysipelotrichaceae bacterium]
MNNNKSDSTADKRSSFVMSHRVRAFLDKCKIRTFGQLREFLAHDDPRQYRHIGERTMAQIGKIANMDYEDDEPILFDAINYVFLDSHAFRRYCEKKGLVSMKDLDDFDWVEYRNSSFVNRRWFNNTVELYNQYCRTYKDQSRFEAIMSDDGLMFKDINEGLMELPIWFLAALGVNRRTIYFLLCNEYRTIGSLACIDAKRLEAIVSLNHMESFKKLEGLLKHDLNYLFKDFLERNRTSRGYQMTLLRKKGYTLEEIGKQFNISIERTNVILESFFVSLSLYLDLLALRIRGEDRCIHEGKIADLCGDHDHIAVVMYWLKKSEDWVYLDYCNVYVHKDDADYLDKWLPEITKEMVGNLIDISEKRDDLEKAISVLHMPFLTIERYLTYLRKNGYRSYGDHLVSSELSKGYLYSLVVAWHFRKGISLNEKDLDLLRLYIKEEFKGLKIPTSDKRFKQILSESLIIRDKDTYISPESAYIDEELMEQIRAYIDMSMAAKISYLELYMAFEDRLRHICGIDNHFYFHGVLHYCYHDLYIFKGKYLLKKKKGEAGESLSEQLNDFILKEKRPVKRQELFNAFNGVSRQMIDLAVSSGPVIVWDNNEYYSMDLIDTDDKITDDIDVSIMKVMEDKDGYCASDMLYRYMVENYREDLDKLNVQTYRNLHYIAQNLLSDKYDFRFPHIIRKDQLDDISRTSIVLKVMGGPEEVSLKEYMALVRKYEWKLVSVNKIVTSLQKGYIRISRDIFLKKESFAIEKAAVTQIEDELIPVMGRKGYVSLIDFETYEDFPDIGYEWNNFLLRSIIENYSSRLEFLESSKRDSRYVLGSVILKGSKVRPSKQLFVFHEEG